VDWEQAREKMVAEQIVKRGVRNPRVLKAMRAIPRPVLSPALRIAQVSRMLGGRITPGLYERWYWAMPGHRQALAAVIDARPNIIHANDAMSLPIAIKAAQQTGAKVLFDAHEYSPGQRTNTLKRRAMVIPFLTYLITRYAPRADAMITVEESIARRYQENFGLKAAVIRNAPPYQPLPFHPTPQDHIQLIHHGGAMRDRLLEKMIDVVALSDDRYTLTFMLLPDEDGYLDELKALAARLAPSRVTFRDPVAPADIARTINAYDIGLFLLPPVSLSYAMALPNKFFEFIMAGLAVAIGPSPAMAAIVQQHELGVVADNFEPQALADRLNALTPDDIDAMKQRSLAAAKDLNAENEMRKLHDIYARLLAS